MLGSDRHITAPSFGDVAAWNRWRLENRGVAPAFRRYVEAGTTIDGIDFSRLDMKGMYFHEVSLNGASFDGTSLEGATFTRCSMDEATFRNTGLQGVRMVGCSLEKCSIFAYNMTGAVISFSNMAGSQLSDVRLRRADLEQSNLAACSISGVEFRNTRLLGTGWVSSRIWRSHFVGAKATGADLSDAQITRCRFINGDFSESAFHNSKLTRCRFSQCAVVGADFSGAQLHACVMHGIDLSRALDTAGMRINDSIDSLRAGWGGDSPFRSCFLSYSRADGEFVDRLNGDLAELGILTWLDRNEMGSTRWIETSLQKAIRSHEAFVLVLSQHAAGRDWVRFEAEMADAAQVAIIPIALDNQIGSRPWTLQFLRDRSPIDFAGWRDEGSYARARTELLRRLAKPVPSSCEP